MESPRKGINKEDVRTLARLKGTKCARAETNLIKSLASGVAEINRLVDA